MAASCLLLALIAPATSQEVNQHYENALEASSQKEYRAAFIHLKNALQIDQAHIPARILLAEVHFNLGDIQAAEKEASEALSLGADLNRVLTVYGSALILQKKADELLKLNAPADKLTLQNRFEWAILKGQAYDLTGEHELALAEYVNAQAMFPSNVRANNILASAYLIRDETEKAQELVDKSLTVDPNNEKTWQLNGQLALHKNQQEAALESFERAHELDPEDPLILRSLARSQLELGEIAGLRQSLLRILADSSDDPAATLISAMLVMNEDGDIEKGSQMLREMGIKLTNLEEAGYKSDAHTLFIRATAEYIQRNDESARTLLNAYLRQNSEDLAAIRMLADVYLRGGDRKRAKELLATNKALVLTDYGLSLQLISLYLEDNSLLRAQETLDDVKKLSGDQAYVIVLEAEYLRASGQPETALALLNNNIEAGHELATFGLLRGKLQLESNQYASALQNLDDLVTRFPEDIRVRNYGAVTFMRLGNLDAAQEFIDRALQLDQLNTNARLNQAALLKARGDRDAASAIISSILEDQPENTTAIMLMAHILLAEGDTDEAIQWSKRVYHYSSAATAPLELQLTAYRQSQNWEKALQSALQLTRADRLNTKYMQDLAEVYIELGDYELAQRSLYKLYDFWKDDSERLRTLARLQSQSQNTAAAKKSLERALELEPESFGINLQLAELSLLEGNHEQAESQLASLTSAHGERTELAFLNGEILLADDKPGLAQQAFARAYKLDSANSSALIQLYQLSIAGTGTSEFHQIIESQMSDSEQPTWKIRLLADSYLAQGDGANAARHYEELIARPELQSNSAILNNLANIYADDDLDKALTTAKRGIQANGKNNWALLDTIGWILARKERHEEALAYFREAYALNSTEPEIRFHTGATLLAMGRKTEAERELRAALSFEGDFAWRSEAELMLGEIESS